MNYYILQGTEVLEVNIEQWARWFENENRVVARTQLNEEVMVSTVFLALDHQLIEGGPPLVFETLPFRKKSPSASRESLDSFMRRYSTWSQALQGHEEVCQEVRNKLLHKSSFFLNLNEEYQENE